ncbi:MAG: hypothetical protein ACT4QF_04040 [Sporichthyaceae bacterium]
MTRRRPDDTGASLLIVLAFMTFVGLVAGAVLSYGGASLTGTGATKARTDISYDADGALKAGVNQIRNSTYDNDSDIDPCDLNGSAAGSTLTYPGANTASSLAVACTGGLGTGVDGGLVPINSSNRPGSALLTLGTSPAETGFEVQAAGSGSALRIKGQVYVNSNAAVGSSGSIVVQNAQFHSRTGCSGTVVSEVPKNCADTGTGAAWSDPGYAAPDVSSLTLQKAPAASCSSAPATIVFEPGYYDDVVFLNNLTGPSQCAGKTLWFKPGTYFFDFHNGEGAPLAAAEHEWSISRDVTIVAGTRSAAWTSLTQPPAVPGACVSPLNTVENNGVQFVFGGDSHIDMTAGRMEICGNYSATQPAISVYGMKTGADTTYANRTAFGSGNSTPSASPAVAPFSSRTKAYALDNDPAVAELDTTGSGNPPDTAGIALTGFVPAEAIPAGSLLGAATLTVVHRQNTAQTNVFGNNALSVEVASTRSGNPSLFSSAWNAAPVGAAATTNTTTTLDVLAALQAEVHDHGLADGLRIGFRAKIANNRKATVNLDGIRLTLTWKPPAVRAQSGCVTTVPAQTNYNGSGGCYLVQIDGNSTIAYFQGTTYAPRAAIYVKLNNVSQQVFKSGLVVRAVGVFVTGSFQYSGPVFEIPSDSLGPGPTEVYFRAYSCPEGLSCSTDPATAVGNWYLVGTARVSFDDGANTGAPSPGSRGVEVKSWTLYR